MGGCPMGQYGWGNVQEKELIDAVSAAMDRGINFFDTADTYGLGTSERTLAKALAGKRENIIIADKFGVRVENGQTFYDNSPKWIEKALAGSLESGHTGKLAGDGVRDVGHSGIHEGFALHLRDGTYDTLLFLDTVSHYDHVIEHHGVFLHHEPVVRLGCQVHIEVLESQVRDDQTPAFRCIQGECSVDVRNGSRTGAFEHDAGPDDGFPLLIGNDSGDCSVVTGLNAGFRCMADTGNL